MPCQTEGGRQLGAGVDCSLPGSALSTGRFQREFEFLEQRFHWGGEGGVPAPPSVTRTTGRWSRMKQRLPLAELGDVAPPDKPSVPFSGPPGRGLDRYEVSIGTSDTTEVGHGCPCGTSHPSPRVWRRRRPSPGDHARIVGHLTDAYASGKASGDPQRGSHVLHFAGQCERPIQLRKSASKGALFVTYETRCRRCPDCLRARMNYWALAAVNQTVQAHERGDRTWFGTLTLRPQAIAAIKVRVFEQWASEQGSASVEPPGWIEQPECDFRFGLMRDQLVRELQLYWKRLRKAGHRFHYLVVFERHKSGEPHMHWLLHEVGGRISKRALQAQWPHGFTQVKLVNASDGSPRSVDRAAWYVAKYLGKEVQSRQLASIGYRPSRKEDDHQYALSGVKGENATRDPQDRATRRGAHRDSDIDEV